MNKIETLILNTLIDSSQAFQTILSILNPTLNDEQKERYEIVNNKEKKASFYLLISIGVFFSLLLIGSLIFFFFSEHIKYLAITLFISVIAVIVSIKFKNKAIIEKLKFYKTLHQNINLIKEKKEQKDVQRFLEQLNNSKHIKNT